MKTVAGASLFEANALQSRAEIFSNSARIICVNFPRILISVFI
jgi:hypothetical protein